MLWHVSGNDEKEMMSAGEQAFTQNAIEHSQQQGNGRSGGGESAKELENLLAEVAEIKTMLANFVGQGAAERRARDSAERISAG